MHVLLGSDGSPASLAAVELLERIPFPADAEITLLAVLHKTPSATARSETIATRIAERIERLLSVEADRLTSIGWKTRFQTCVGHFPDQVVQKAIELGADLIVLTSQATKGTERFLHGNVSRRVMEDAHCSVLTYRPSVDRSSTPARERPLRILVGYDGSEEANRAANMIASWQLKGRAELLIVTVLPLVTSFRMDILQTQSPSWQVIRRAAYRELEELKQCLGKTAPEVTVQIREGHSECDEIRRAAAIFDADLVVVGATVSSALKQLFLGSVSSHLAHYAPCSVLIVKPNRAQAKRTRRLWNGLSSASPWSDSLLAVIIL